MKKIVMVALLVAFSASTYAAPVVVDEVKGALVSAVECEKKVCSITYTVDGSEEKTVGSTAVVGQEAKTFTDPSMAGMTTSLYLLDGRLVGIDSFGDMFDEVFLNIEKWQVRLTKVRDAHFSKVVCAGDSCQLSYVSPNGSGELFARMSLAGLATPFAISTTPQLKTTLFVGVLNSEIMYALVNPKGKVVFEMPKTSGQSQSQR